MTNYLAAVGVRVRQHGMQYCYDRGRQIFEQIKDVVTGRIVVCYIFFSEFCSAASV